MRLRRTLIAALLLLTPFLAFATARADPCPFCMSALNNVITADSDSDD